MDVTKKIKYYLLLTYLAFLPFGYFFLILERMANIRFTVLPGDLIVLCLSVICVYESIKNNAFHKKHYFLLVYLLFSQILFFTEYWHFSLSGHLYGLRLIAYFICFMYLQKLSRHQTRYLKSALFISGSALITLGILQYFAIPDTRILKALGFDDHYYRLIGAFLDPGYMGIMLVLFLLFALLFLKSRGTTLLFALGALVSIFLTYSRATYLALFVSLVVYWYLKERLKKVFFLKILLLVALIFAAILLLPKPGGEGVNLARTFSIFLRIENYTESLKVWVSHPLFGVGVNNLCEYRNIIGSKTTEIFKNSCLGVDNSIIFTLATFGILGVILLGKEAKDYWNSLAKKSKNTLLPFLAAIFVHSMFHNTFYYTFVMGFLLILNLLVLRPKE